MKQKTVYYAHAMCTYDSHIEAMDIQTLEAMGFKVLNPNTKEVQSEYLKVKDHHITHGTPMLFWQELATSCDVFAFRALPGGKIPGGVAAELTAARNAGKSVIELPSVGTDRFLSHQQTKDYLFECGYYKPNK